VSNPVTEARTDVAAALNAIPDLRVHDLIPSKMTAPAAIVAPGSPYVVPGQVFGEFRVALNVRVFVKTSGTNEVASKGMDALIVAVCDALHGFGVVSVSTPGVDRESYDNPYLVADITINTSYKGGN